jgi:hypothetical protein
MAEYSEFELTPDPESNDGNRERSLRRELALRIASALTLAGVAGGMLWMAYGIDQTTHDTVADTDHKPIIPIDTVMAPAPENAAHTVDVEKYVEVAGAGLLLGLSSATIRFARRGRQGPKLDGSHDRYEDPLDSKLFEGYCKQVTSRVVWVDDKIIGSGSYPHNPEINVE